MTYVAVVYIEPKLLEYKHTKGSMVIIVQVKVSSKYECHR